MLIIGGESAGGLLRCGGGDGFAGGLRWSRWTGVSIGTFCFVRIWSAGCVMNGVGVMVLVMNAGR